MMPNQLDTNLVTIEAKDMISATLKGIAIPTDERNTAGLPKLLILSVGARVMLIRKVNVCDGLANGTQGKIVDFILSSKTPVAILVRFDNSKVRRETRSITKFDLSRYSKDLIPIEPVEEMVSLKTKNSPNLQVTRRQYPLKLSCACTVHKVQGQSLDSVIVSVKDVFNPGRAYVAFSRAINYERSLCFGC